MGRKSCARTIFLWKIVITERPFRKERAGRGRKENVVARRVGMIARPARFPYPLAPSIA
ncbi:hypothetical protein [Fertoeibacter niger]|uniref:hypothetical protein n=1 Tax=Fertoeibacter niger TaxID=2656921 RepID=UPI00157BF8FD|nr:hypothetical protein [Fertoeibacter niger]